VPQLREQRPRQRHATVSYAFAVAHPDHEALGVDVSRFKAQAFAEAKTERVDSGERHAAHRVAHGAEHRAHLARAQHHRPDQSRITSVASTSSRRRRL
jgi:hypothetical protein